MPRKIQFPVGLDRDLEEKLNEVSKKERLSKSEIVRIALREYFRQKKLTKGDAKMNLETIEKNIKVKEIDYSLTDGFAYIIFENGTEEYNLQACLRELTKCKDEQIRYNLIKENKSIYKKEIDRNDDGMNDGICGYVNSNAFAKLGIESCSKFFYKEIKKLGIKIK